MLTVHNPHYEPYITKFFDQGSLHHYQAGSLRIGTLEYYSAEENRIQQGARYDPNEGKYSGAYEQVTPWVTDIDVPGIRVAPGSRASLEGASFGNTINTYVFCSSIGQYSEALHRSILCPSPNGYPGNASLVGFVTFRTEELMEALSETAMRTFGLPLSADQSPWLHYGRVTYGERHRIESLSSGKRGLSWEPRFVKSHFFEPEKEFRMILNKDFPNSPTAGAASFSLKGPEIISAMCDGPRLIPLHERDRWLQET